MREDVYVHSAHGVGAEEHGLELRAAVGDGLELLVRGAAIEDLHELGLVFALVSEHLLQPGGGKYQVAWKNKEKVKLTRKCHLIN